MKCNGAEPRHGKTVAKEILSKINNVSYGKYYNDTYGNHPKGLLRNRINCSDTAPHQKEIKELTVPVSVLKPLTRYLYCIMLMN